VCSSDLCNNNIFYHDWWAYIIVYGCGGTIIYDDQPYIRYRQHGDNLIGCKMNFKARFKRLILVLLSDKFKNAISNNVNLLLKYSDKLSSENLQQLINFVAIRKSKKIFTKMLALKTLNIKKKGLLSTIVYSIFFMFNRI
jgi:hypothetical protein